MAVGIQPEEFAVAVTNLWASDSTLSANCPGGIHLKAAPEEASILGYAIINITGQDARVMADRNWLQTVDIQIEVYSSRPMDATQRAGINTAATAIFCSNNLTLPSGAKSCGAAIPINAGATLADLRRSGESVIITTLAFRYLMQGSF